MKERDGEETKQEAETSEKQRNEKDRMREEARMETWTRRNSINTDMRKRNNKKRQKQIDRAQFHL